MLNVLLVGAGGAAGALLRFGVVALVRPASPNFPLGTLLVNLSGCLVIGLLGGWLLSSPEPREQFRLLVLVGVLGGYTTFSSYALEVAEMLRQGRWGWAAAYILVSNLVGLGLAFGGYVLVAGRSAGA